MSLDLSGGFMAAAQLEGRFPDFIVSANFLAANTVLDVGQPDGSTLTLWFDEPSVALPREAPDSAEIHIGMTARLSNRIDEGSVSVVGRGRIVDHTVTSGGRTFASPALDLGQAGDVVLSSPTGSPFEGPALAAVTTILRSQSPWVLGPAALGSGARAYRSYVAEDGFQNHLVTFLPAAGQPTPPGIERFVSVTTDAAVVIPDDIVNLALSGAMTQAGLASFPVQINPDVRATRLSVSLQQGHILVDAAGVVTTDILGIDIDTDVTFKVFIQPLIQNGRVVVNVLGTQQSFDGAVADVADLLTAGAITRLMEDMLPRALDGLALGSLQGLDFFASSLAPRDGASAAVGEIPTVRANGLVIPYDVSIEGSPQPVKPPYIRGHRESHEFHVTPCPFGDLIKEKNLRRFPSASFALLKGYDGCSTCQPDFSIASFADVEVELAHPDGVEELAEATLQLDYNDSLVRFGITLAPDPEVRKAPFSPPDANGVPTHHFFLGHVVPASSTLTLTCGSWSQSVPVVLAKRFIDAQGGLQGPVTKARATVGQPGIELVPG
jgi:hypothetical protein